MKEEMVCAILQVNIQKLWKAITTAKSRLFISWVLWVSTESAILYLSLICSVHKIENELFIVCLERPMDLCA